jgi:hypothetical protein
MFGLVLAGILGGYMLQPVPRKLDELFKNNIFKFFVLVFIGYVTFLPITEQKFIYIIGVSAALLIIFELLRRYD